MFSLLLVGVGIVEERFSNNTIWNFLPFKNLFSAKTWGCEINQMKKKENKKGFSDSNFIFDSKL